MTLIERYKASKRELDACQDEYSRCLQYALQAKRNRDEANSKMLIARHALAEDRGIETVGEFE